MNLQHISMRIIKKKEKMGGGWGMGGGGAEKIEQETSSTLSWMSLFRLSQTDVTRYFRVVEFQQAWLFSRALNF